MEIHDAALEKLLIRGCSDKKRIRNKEQADRAIDYLADKGVLMYYYNCPFCSKFHLTSSPPNEEFNRAILKAIIKRANSYVGHRQDNRGA